jgi:hypothetical protein
MTPDSEGCFCAHCQKTVIDFTEWSDEALYRFLSTNNQNICGSVRKSQLGRPLALPNPPKSRLRRAMVAAGLTLLFAQGAPIQAHPKPPMQYIIPGNRVSTEDTTTNTGGEGSLSGVVLDYNRQPLFMCRVELLQHTKTIATTQTDTNGCFVFSNICNGTYLLQLTFAGYARLQIDVEISGTTYLKKPLELEPRDNGNFEGIPVREKRKHRRHRHN